MDANSGEILALASEPIPQPDSSGKPDELLDRVRYGRYPPGSTFKLVTAIAALRRNPSLTRALSLLHWARQSWCSHFRLEPANP